MTPNRKVLLKVCDVIDYNRSELVSCACDLEDVGYTNVAESLRSVANDLEQLCFNARHTRIRRTSSPIIRS